MRKNSILVVAWLTCSFSLSAQLLWKISGNGLKHPSYLFGTHHLTPVSFLDSVPGLYKAFNSCEVVIGEMVMNNIDATEKIQKAAVMPKNLKINDLLTKEEYTLVDKEIYDALQMHLNDVSIMYPSLILNIYEIETYRKLTGLKDDILSDSYFQLVATEKNRKVIGLESIDDQIYYLFQNSSPSRQAELLVNAIKQKDQTLAEIIEINKLYKAGRITELMNLARKEGNFSKEEYEKIVDQRNANWSTILPKYLSESSCFIAVGAMHLPGPNGLIVKLQKAGYKVKAVDAEE